MIRRVCVFCGSQPGRRSGYANLARGLGARLAREGLGLVYGGGRAGTMGSLSSAALSAGGEVIGVIPQTLMEREYARRDLTELRIVGSMHERKALMHDLADAYIVLAGGLGTLDELFGTLTSAQLGLHHKPVALLDSCGYFETHVATSSLCSPCLTTCSPRASRASTAAISWPSRTPLIRPSRTSSPGMCRPVPVQWRLADRRGHRSSRPWQPSPANITWSAGATRSSGWTSISMSMLSPRRKTSGHAGVACVDSLTQRTRAPFVR